jgi:hypothetical protein
MSSLDTAWAPRRNDLKVFGRTSRFFPSPRGALEAARAPAKRARFTAAKLRHQRLGTWIAMPVVVPGMVTRAARVVGQNDRQKIRKKSQVGHRSSGQAAICNKSKATRNRQAGLHFWNAPMKILPVLAFPFGQRMRVCRHDWCHCCRRSPAASVRSVGLSQEDVSLGDAN